ncbi:MAG: hypothetical protein KBC35_00325 [Candidatus Pacebacteria bacterium]|nr:hypothetical protein [Candidatus Paceibacterota bacterium]
MPKSTTKSLLKTAEKSTSISKAPRVVTSRHKAVVTSARKVAKTKEKPIANKVISKTVKPKLAKGKVRSAASEEKISSIALPSNMSQRAIEKSRALMEEFEHYFGDAMYRISYVTAVCFILVGATYATASFVGDSVNHEAQIIGSIDNSIGTIPTGDLTADGSTGIVNTYPIPKSVFAFLSVPPSNIVEPTAVSFEATYAQDVLAKLVDISKNASFPLSVERVTNEKYKVLIPPTFAAGYYELRIYVKPANGDSSYARVTNDFFMGSSQMEDAYNDQDSLTQDDSSNDSGVDVASEDLTTSGSEDDNTATSGGTSGENIDDTTTGDDSDTTDNATGEISEVDETQAVTNTVDPNLATEPSFIFKLQTPLSTTLSANANLRLSAPEDATFVELYARPTNSLNARFITLAIKRTGYWTFYFDTKNIPNGSYEFFAKTKYNEKILITPSVHLSIKNDIVTKALTAEQEEAVTTEERELITINDTTNQETVVSPTPALPPPPNPTQALPPPPSPASSEQPVSSTEAVNKTYTVSAEQTTQLIQENEADLNTLFVRYAAARQAGDQSLILSAQEALEQKRQEMVLATLQDQDRKVLSDSLNEQTLERFTDLQNRIDTFEEIRKERSNGATAVDTDGDGISDMDEVKLYKTDPAVADSDNDGVTDGIEVMRGYDPLDIKQEAVVRFESPKETIGLVREDVLQVHEILPLVRDSEASEQPQVATEIKGRGLPNSFVTLYIFSSPTVVTVKTDADGMFVYTFDKELEDGQHDVYVTMTDNAGEIIAQSNPFSFVKEAQAFTVVQAAESEVVTPVSITEASADQGYGIAIGVGILALGLILLMLGISLRRAGDNKVVVTENIVNDGDDQEQVATS